MKEIYKKITLGPSDRDLRDAEAMTQADQAGSRQTAFKFAQMNRSFSVSTERFTGTMGVRFYLQDELIVAESHGLRQPVSVKASLTLNDHGECRLLVDGAELQPWQFLKRALEPLLFGPVEWQLSLFPPPYRNSLLRDGTVRAMPPLDAPSLLRATAAGFRVSGTASDCGAACPVASCTIW